MYFVTVTNSERAFCVSMIFFLSLLVCLQFESQLGCVWSQNVKLFFQHIISNVEMVFFYLSFYSHFSLSYLVSKETKIV